MSERSLEARFEEFDGHRSVVVAWTPRTRVRAHAVFVPAFGDEMNQTRRMVKLTAEALASRGVASSVFDLYGTGDSSADFSDATVDRWLADCRSMAARVASGPALPLVLIGCRLGVALAVHASRRLMQPAAALIGWAPLLQGRTQLSGLLRAANVARFQQPDIGEPDARSSWSAGRTANLGGYPISPSLASQLEALDATNHAPRAMHATLIEVRQSIGKEPVSASAALTKSAVAWSEQGTSTDVLAVEGAGFWNVADLVDVPALVERTVDVVDTTLSGNQHA